MRDEEDKDGGIRVSIPLSPYMYSMLRQYAARIDVSMAKAGKWILEDGLRAVVEDKS